MSARACWVCGDAAPIRRGDVYLCPEHYGISNESMREERKVRALERIADALEARATVDATAGQSAGKDRGT